MLYYRKLYSPIFIMIIVLACTTCVCLRAFILGSLHHPLARQCRSLVEFILEFILGNPIIISVFRGPVPSGKTTATPSSVAATAIARLVM